MCACRNWFFHRAQGNFISCCNFIYLFSLLFTSLGLHLNFFGFVSNVFAFLLLYPFDFLVQVICSTVHNSAVYCTNGHYLAPAWPHFFQRNLSNFQRVDPLPGKLWLLAHVPLLCKRVWGENGSRKCLSLVAICDVQYCLFCGDSQYIPAHL